MSLSLEKVSCPNGTIFKFVGVFLYNVKPRTLKKKKKKVATVDC